jgi:hypothetical protein
MIWYHKTQWERRSDVNLCGLLILLLVVWGQSCCPSFSYFVVLVVVVIVVIVCLFFLFCSACCCCYCRHCLFVFLILYRPFTRKIPLYFWLLCVRLSKTDPNYFEGYYYCACSIVFETKCHFHNVKSSEWTHRNRKMSKYITRPMYERKWVSSVWRVPRS